MKIASIGYAVPSRRVTNELLIEEFRRKNRRHFLTLGVLERKLRQAFEQSGTDVRYRRADGERALDLTAQAGRQALERADIPPDQVDLLIYTGVGRGCLEPAMAHIFKSVLGLKRATCFDVMDACASWMRSLSVAKAFLDQGTYKTVMVLNSEFGYERVCGDMPLKDPKHLYYRFAGYTLGEAATATILTGNGRPDDFYLSLKSWEDSYHLCRIALPNYEEYLPDPASQNGSQALEFWTLTNELLSFVVRKLAAHAQEDARLAQQTYDIIFLHDVSELATMKGFKILGHLWDRDITRLYRTHARFGNTVSASIPLGMALALEDGRLRPDMQVLAICGSAGVSTGFCSFRYEP